MTGTPGKPVARSRFTMIPDELLLDPDVPPTRLKTWAGLRRLAWDARAPKGVGVPKELPPLAEMAKVLGIGETRLKTCIRELRRDGWLRTERTNRSRATTYTIYDSPLPEAERQKEPEGARRSDSDSRNAARQSDSDSRRRSDFDSRHAARQSDFDSPDSRIPTLAPSLIEERLDTTPNGVGELALASAANGGVVEVIEGEVVGEVVPTGALSAQSLTAHFIDESRDRGVDPPKRIIGQVARYAKQLLDEGQPYEAVQAGIDLMLDKGVPIPSALPSFVMEAALPKRPTRRRQESLRYGRGLTPRQILDQLGGGAT